MSQFKVLDKSSAKPASAAILNEVEKKFGFIPNLMGVLAESPVAIKAYVALSELVSQSSFSPEEQQAILLAVSVENGCDYCVSAHSMMAAKMAGMSPENLNALRSGKALENKKLNTLVRFTKDVVNTRGLPSKESITDFTQAEFSNQQLLEVLVCVAMKTLSNYTNHIAQTPVDQAFAEFMWAKKD